MWNRLSGKSDKATDPPSKSSTRRKNEKEAELSQQQTSVVVTTGSKSISSQPSDDVIRGFNSSSARYKFTEETSLPGAAEPSVAPYYAVIGNDHETQYKPPELVKIQGFAGTMDKSRFSQDGFNVSQDDAIRSNSGIPDSVKERSSKNDDNTNGNEKREQREYEGTDERIDRPYRKDKSRKNSESSKNKYRRQEMNNKGAQEFSSLVESNGLAQYPGRSDVAMTVSGTHPQEHHGPISSHIQDQFPGQFPTESSLPYIPPVGTGGGGPGLAAEYYGDAGESVAEQPGFRKQSPSLIVGAEPHLQPASSIAAPPPEPSQLGETGAAASFYDANFEGIHSSSTNPDPSLYASVPSRPNNNHSSSSAPAITTLGGSAIGATAAGYMMSGGLSLQQQELNHGSIGGAHPSTFSVSANKPSMSQSHASVYAPSIRPPKQDDSSQSSHTPLYAAGAAGAAGLAAAAYAHGHQQHAQHSLTAQQHLITPLRHRHYHRGPLSTLVDFFRDPEGVAQYEEYTEFIGVCRGCFEPGSSPRDAPRKHRYYKRRSKDKIGNNTRVDKQRRYSSSEEEYRKKKKVSWLGAGLAGYGLGKVGETLFNQRNDFDDTYDVRSGRFSPSEINQAVQKTPEKVSRRKYHSEVKAETGIITNGKIYYEKSDPTKYTSPQQPRSRLRDRKTGLAATSADIRTNSATAASESQRRNHSPPQASSQGRRASRDQSPVQHRRKDKRKKQKSFFSFLSPSSSSSSLDLSSRSEKEKRKKRRNSSDKIKNSREAEAALLGLGAATAALAFKDGRSKSKTSKEVESAKRKSDKVHRNSKIDRSGRSTVSSEEVWESASEGSFNEVDSDLAFGSPLRRSSFESLSSRSSGTDKWDWRWGKRERRQSLSQRKTPVGDSTWMRTSTNDTSLAGAATPLSDQHITPANDRTGSLPLEHVYPVPTSDPGRFDAKGEDSTTSTIRPVVVSRPEAGPIQQPQPIAPVSSKVYSTRAAVSHSSEVPIFSQPSYRPQSSEDRSGSMTSVNRVSPRHVSVAEERIEGIRLQRRGTSPARLEHDVIQNARYPQRAPSSKDDSSTVRFAPSAKQEDREQNERHRKRSEKNRRNSRNDSGRRSSSEKQSNERNAVPEPQKDDEYDKKTSGVISAIGAAGAGAVGAAVITEQSNQKETREERRERRRREREREDEEEALIRSERRRRKERERKNAPDSSNRWHTDGSEEKVTSKRDQESTNDVSPQRKSIWQDAARLKQTTHEDYQSFFAPTDVLNKESGQVKATSADSNANINLVEIAPKPKRTDEPEYSVADTDEHIDLSTVSLSWPVPRLKLHPPTPPATRASTPVSESILTNQQDGEGASKERSPSKVIWEDDQTHKYPDVVPSKAHDAPYSSSQEEVGRRVSTEEHSDSEPNGRPSPIVLEEGQSLSRSPTLPESSQSLQDDHEFAATLAAGAQEAGFDPTIVINDPTYRRRESPPRSEDHVQSLSFEKGDEPRRTKKGKKIPYKAAESQEFKPHKDRNDNTIVENIVRQVEQSRPSEIKSAGDGSREANTLEEARRSSSEQLQEHSVREGREIEADTSTFPQPSKEAARNTYTGELVEDQTIGKKPRKKSKPQSSEVSDATSTKSSSADVAAEKDAEPVSRKGSFWDRVLGRSTDDLSQSKPTGDEPNGAVIETSHGWEERDRISRERQVLPILNDDAISIPSLSAKRDNKDETRQVSGVSELHDADRTTHNSLHKDKKPSVSEDISKVGTAALLYGSSFEEPSESFLGMRPEPPPPPDINSTPEEPPGQAHPDQKRISEHTKRRPSEILVVESQQPHRTTSSPTAVPVYFRRPQSSPGFKRSASLSLRFPTQQGAEMAPKLQARPRSTDFKSSKEFRPLLLVEKHQSYKESSPAESYPPLPDSHSTSAASSIKDTEDISPNMDEQEISDRNYGPGDLIDAVHEGSQADILGSQQATPTATSFRHQANQVVLESPPSPTVDAEPSSRSLHFQDGKVDTIMSGNAVSALNKDGRRFVSVSEEIPIAKDDQSQAASNEVSPLIENHKSPVEQLETFQQTREFIPSEERHTAEVNNQEGLTPVEEKSAIALEVLPGDAESARQLIYPEEVIGTTMQDSEQDSRFSMTESVPESSKSAVDLPHDEELFPATSTAENQLNNSQSPDQIHSIGADEPQTSATSAKKIDSNDSFIAATNIQQGQLSHIVEVEKDAAEVRDSTPYAASDMHELSPLTTPLPDSDDFDLFEVLHQDNSFQNGESRNAYKTSIDGSELVGPTEEQSQIQPAAEADIEQDKEIDTGTPISILVTQDKAINALLAEDGKPQSGEVDRTLIQSKPTEDVPSNNNHLIPGDFGDEVDPKSSKDECKPVKSGSEDEVATQSLEEPQRLFVTNKSYRETAAVAPEIQESALQDSVGEVCDAHSEEQILPMSDTDIPVTSDPAFLAHAGKDVCQSPKKMANRFEDDVEDVVPTSQCRDDTVAQRKKKKRKFNQTKNSSLGEEAEERCTGDSTTGDLTSAFASKINSVKMVDDQSIAKTSDQFHMEDPLSAESDLGVRKDTDQANLMDMGHQSNFEEAPVLRYGIPSTADGKTARSSEVMKEPLKIEGGKTFEVHPNEQGSALPEVDRDGIAPNESGNSSLETKNSPTPSETKPSFIKPELSASPPNASSEQALTREPTPPAKESHQDLHILTNYPVLSKSKKKDKKNKKNKKNKRPDVAEYGAVEAQDELVGGKLNPGDAVAPSEVLRSRESSEVAQVVEAGFTVAPEDLAPNESKKAKKKSKKSKILDLEPIDRMNESALALKPSSTDVGMEAEPTDTRSQEPSDILIPYTSREAEARGSPASKNKRDEELKAKTAACELHSENKETEVSAEHEFPTIDTAPELMLSSKSFPHNVTPDASYQDDAEDQGTSAEVKYDQKAKKESHAIDFPSARNETEANLAEASSFTEPSTSPKFSDISPIAPSTLEASASTPDNEARDKSSPSESKREMKEAEKAIHPTSDGNSTLSPEAGLVVPQEERPLIMEAPQDGIPVEVESMKMVDISQDVSSLEKSTDAYHGKALDSSEEATTIDERVKAADDKMLESSHGLAAVDKLSKADNDEKIDLSERSLHSDQIVEVSEDKAVEPSKEALAAKEPLNANKDKMIDFYQKSIPSDKSAELIGDDLVGSSQEAPSLDKLSKDNIDKTDDHSQGDINMGDDRISSDNKAISFSQNDPDLGTFSEAGKDFKDSSQGFLDRSEQLRSQYSSELQESQSQAFQTKKVLNKSQESMTELGEKADDGRSLDLDSLSVGKPQGDEGRDSANLDEPHGEAQELLEHNLMPLTTADVSNDKSADITPQDSTAAAEVPEQLAQSKEDLGFTTQEAKMEEETNARDNEVPSSPTEKGKKESKRAEASKFNFRANAEEPAEKISNCALEETSPDIMNVRDEHAEQLMARSEKTDEMGTLIDITAVTSPIQVKDLRNDILTKGKDGGRPDSSQMREIDVAPASQSVRPIVNEPQEPDGPSTISIDENKDVCYAEILPEKTHGTLSQQDEDSSSVVQQDGESVKAQMETITEDAAISQAAETGEIKETEFGLDASLIEKVVRNRNDDKPDQLTTEELDIAGDHSHDEKHAQPPPVETLLSAGSVELLDAEAQEAYDEKYARELQRNLGPYADKPIVNEQPNESTSSASGNIATEQAQEPQGTLASVTPLEDIVEEPRSRSGSVQHIAAPENELTSMESKKARKGKKSKKGKKGKKQEQIVIWEDDTATLGTSRSVEAPPERLDSESGPLNLEEYIEPDHSQKEIETPLIGSPSLRRLSTRGDDKNADYFGIQPAERAEMDVGDTEADRERSLSQRSSQDRQAERTGEQSAGVSRASLPTKKNKKDRKKTKPYYSGQEVNGPSPDAQEAQSSHREEVDKPGLHDTPKIPRDPSPQQKDPAYLEESDAVGATIGTAAVAAVAAERLSREKSKEDKKKDNSRSKSATSIQDEPPVPRRPEELDQQTLLNEKPPGDNKLQSENVEVASSPSGEASEKDIEHANMRNNQDSSRNRDSTVHFNDSSAMAGSGPVNCAGRDSEFPDIENSILDDEKERDREELTERAIIDSYTEPSERNSTFTEKDIIESYQNDSCDRSASPSSSPGQEESPSRAPFQEPVERPATSDQKSERKRSQRPSEAAYDSDDSADSGFDVQKRRRRLQTLAEEQREPSPVASTTKDRSSGLFDSSPSGRDCMANQLPDQLESGDHLTSEATEEERVLRKRDKRHFEPSWSFADVSEEKANTAQSLFGGPIRNENSPSQTNSPNGNEQQPPRRESERDIQQPPQLLPHQNQISHTSAVGSSDKDSSLAKRKRSYQEDRHFTGDESSVNRRNAERMTSRQQSSAELPTSTQDDVHPPAITPADSIHAIIRSPDQVRSASGQSFRSSGTPPLRRVDRSASGDLRAASRKDEAKIGASPKISEEAELAPEPESESESLAEQPDFPPATSSAYDPLTDKGKEKADSDMADYEGWGDVRSQSPMSPTRPPSMRKRQSLYFAEMEQRLAMLASENNLLQTAKSNAEQRLEEQAQDHSQQRESYDIAIREHKAYIAEKDSKLHDLSNILDELRHQVAHLTKTNEELLQSREQEAKGQHDWERTSRDLEDLRVQHTRLANEHEDIIAREVDKIHQEKEIDLQNLRDELESAKEQVRKLQQQILASGSMDDIVEHDEDYFDAQCQDLCKHLISWVKRFSKLSDNKRCFLASEIRDNAHRELFEDSMLDGSEVDDYLQDRHKRRDVFMSIIMTLTFRHVFARYLFGMDREHRQKLKTLDKTLQEVGPPSAVHKWRATTLTLLSKRPAFQSQRDTDSEAVVADIWATLSSALPPPPTSVQTAQCRESLRRVVNLAVDLSIDMRLQRAEYSMLPPPEPDFDPQTGDIRNRLHFNATSMNERSGTSTSNEELEEQGAWLRMVLFPLVVKITHEEDNIVVCPAQVHVAPMKKGKTVRVVSAQGERSEASYDGGTEDTVMEGGML